MRYLFLLLLFSSCIPKTETDAEPQKHFVLLPKAASDSKPYSFQEKPILLNPVFYIGPFPDTVDLDKAFGYDTMWLRSFENNNDSVMRILPYFKNKQWHATYEREILTKSEKPSKDSITITIDTTQLSSSKNISRSQYNDQTTTIGETQCYPVTISNIGKDTIFFYSLEIFVEAQKLNQNWQRQSNLWESKCLTGEPMYWFAPGETIVTVVPKFAGSTKADFRVAFLLGEQTFYSQVYSGSVNVKF